MRTLLGLLMIVNTAVFLFGSVQHTGIALGPFHEPRIIPAAIVEGICAFLLLSAAVAILVESALGWRAALIANLVALAGVLLGIAALAAGAGPRTASNEVYHHIMLILIGASLAILFYARSILTRG
jgi:hypothetical protein